MNFKPVKKIGRNILIVVVFFLVCSCIPQNYFIYTIGMLIGLFAVTMCGYILRKYFRAKKYWVYKRGTVVSVDADWFPTMGDNPGTDIYNPVIQFETDEGVEYTVTSSEGSSLSDYSEGTWVYIYYNPADPNQIIMDDGNLIGVNFLFFIAGLVLLIVFNVLIVVHPEYLR